MDLNRGTRVHICVVLATRLRTPLPTYLLAVVFNVRREDTLVDEYEFFEFAFRAKIELTQ